jgi:hypothetical protein
MDSPRERRKALKPTFAGVCPSASTVILPRLETDESLTLHPFHGENVAVVDDGKTLLDDRSKLTRYHERSPDCAVPARSGHSGRDLPLGTGRRGFDLGLLHLPEE